MKYRTRIQYTEADKALMWERWRRGESLQAIAQLFDRNHSAIGGILVRTGGIWAMRCVDRLNPQPSGVGRDRPLLGKLTTKCSRVS